MGEATFDDSYFQWENKTLPNAQYLEWASPGDSDLPMPLSWFNDTENKLLTHAQYVLNPIDFCADRESIRMLVIVSRGYASEKKYVAKYKHSPFFLFFDVIP